MDVRDTSLEAPSVECLSACGCGQDVDAASFRWHRADGVISHGDGLTDGVRFFLAPEKPLHRQYEALCAHFVDQQPSQEVARRFGYTSDPSASFAPSSAMSVPVTAASLRRCATARRQRNAATPCGILSSACPGTRPVS